MDVFTAGALQRKKKKRMNTGPEFGKLDVKCEEL